MSLRTGIVVATHPEDHSYDLVMSDDGSRLVGVQLLSMDGSARTGSVDMPAVPEKGDKWDITQTNGQDQKAVVGFVGSNPVILGFLYPQINQMLSDDPKLRLYRHQSDVYDMTDGDGNSQWAHPSGAYVRIAEDPDFVDMAGKNIDKSMSVDRNTGKSVHFRLSLADQSVVVTMTPGGTTTITMKEDFILVAEGDVSVTAHKSATVHADQDVTVTAGESITVNSGNDTVVNVDGNADIKISGWGQIVAEGALLIKSLFRLKLKGPSMEINL